MSVWTSLTVGLVSLTYWTVYLSVVLLIPIWCSLKVSHQSLDTNHDTVRLMRQRWVLYLICLVLLEFVIFPVLYKIPLEFMQPILTFAKLFILVALIMPVLGVSGKVQAVLESEDFKGQLSHLRGIVCSQFGQIMAMIKPKEQAAVTDGKKIA